MTRLDLLKIVVGRARANGFEFRRWYVSRLGLPWINADAALTALESQRRYYSLLFNHEFARSFWKPGEDITFAVAARSFERVMPDGSVGTVSRKPYIRRSARRDAWRYHLQHMALAEEPLRYIRKYLHVADDLEDETALPAESAPLAEEARTTPADPSSPPAATPSSAKKQPVKAAKSGSRSRKNPQASTKFPTAVAKTRATTATGARPTSRPLPTDLPAFLQRSPEKWKPS